MKKSLLTVFIMAAHGVIQGVTIPSYVVQAIVQIEGGTTGKSKKERNGLYSHGKCQISTAFLKDVNKYYGEKYTIQGVRDHDTYAFTVCKKGIEMIIAKRKCSLYTALAIYNGGYGKRNTATCKDYAKRVLALARKLEQRDRGE